MSYTDSIVESHIDDLKPMFTFHRDGTVEIEQEYRGVDDESLILIYFIAQEYGYRGEIKEESTLENTDLYDKIDKAERTIRSKVQSLREDGLLKKEGQSENRLVVENLPDAVDMIESSREG